MRKISAHYVFDGKGVFLKQGIIVINDDNSIEELIDTGGQLQESESIEFYNGILAPGFVNAHCHLELSHLKGIIPRHQGLTSFVRNVVSHRQTFDEKITDSVKEALSEMQKNGIVAVGDIANKEISLPIKENSNILCYTFLECFGFEDPADNLMYETATGLYEKWKNRLPIAVTPHASYSCSPLLLGKIQVFQERHPMVFSIHNQETESENELFLEKSGVLFDNLLKWGMNPELLEYSGLNSLQTISKYFPTENNKILIHNTFTKDRDITFLHEGFNPDSIFWCFCPNSNLYIENQMPDIEMFTKMDLQCVIGTDSLASNDKLSIIDELITIQNKFPNITLEKLLTWVCINGARALKFDSTIGSFEKGKKPGINLISNLDLVNMKLLDDSNVKVIL